MGYYTQLVWQDTTHVGCGWTQFEECNSVRIFHHETIINLQIFVFNLSKVVYADKALRAKLM